jgi:hypothetical protein
MLRYYQFSFQVIVDRIVELLNTPGDADHVQIKVCPLSFLSRFTYT